MRTSLAGLALLLLSSAAPAAQPCRDALIRIRPDCRFAPVQSSAVVAYLASIGATAALVGGGYLLYEYGPGDPTRSSFNSEEVGIFVMSLGALVGPSVGNLTLGAGDAAARGMTPKMIGTVVGSSIALGGVGIAIGCVLGNVDGGDCGLAGDVAVGLVVTGAAVTAGGILVGTVIDLATIPGSARRVRAEQRAARSAVTASAGPQGLALRVAL